MDADADRDAVLLELAARERDELIDDEIRSLARREHLEHRADRPIHRHVVERGAQRAAERAAQLSAAAAPVLLQCPAERLPEVAAEASGVVGVLEPRAEACREIRAAEPPLDGFAHEKMVANEARECAADLILARRHDRGMGNR
jgi:hypothetical protein